MLIEQTENRENALIENTWIRENMASLCSQLGGLQNCTLSKA